MMGVGITVVSLGYGLGSSQKAVPLISRGNGHVRLLLLEFPTPLFLVIIPLVLSLIYSLLLNSRGISCQGRSVPWDRELML